jgi:hypothetical protein
MNRDLVREEPPEERELARKLLEAELLERELAERRRDLERLRAGLAVFEATYIHVIGTRFSRLDEIESRIDVMATRSGVRLLRGRGRINGLPMPLPRPGERPVSAAELRRTFRQVAAILHPDLSAHPDENRRRTRLMSEANAAYAERDPAKLREILRRWFGEPEAVPGDGIGARLVRAIRRISLAEERLTETEAAIADLKGSYLFQMKRKVDQAEQEGWDLLVELTILLDEEISTAINHLQELEQA